MAVTYEQLVSVGMSEAQARLLAAELQERDNWARHSMVVALVVVFLGFQGWLALSVANLQTDVALLQNGQSRLEAGQADLEAGQAVLEAGQTALEAGQAAILARLPD